jgi:hypothetical protein
MVDKGNIITRISEGHAHEDFRLELGCGGRKRWPGAIGVDLMDHPCVDIVGDIREVLEALPENSISRIEAFHSLEHVEDIAGVLARAGSVLKNGGVLEIVVPHFSNPYFYSDYTHKQFFGLYSLCYLAGGSTFKRKVPQYQTVTSLRLLKVSLGFKSSPPFYGRHAIKRAVGVLVNSCRAAQEMYEEMFCWMIPCYEIGYILRKEGRQSQ